jgi:enoyl-CoA hydratase/carnithine racemase
LGIIPGAGGTQRLTRTVGKYRAMELVLTGRLISAWEAYRMGLVYKVVPDEALLDEAIRLGREVASKSKFAVELAKESVNKALETTLQQGLDIERRNFYVSISSEDGKEGMRAFLEKRKPNWKF